ncbi:hypothetical protein CXG81DRAFT_11709, partial [Caulochytrium protostelioides]
MQLLFEQALLPGATTVDPLTGEATTAPPYVKIHLYGSSTNGLSSRGSDVDLCLETNCGHVTVHTVAHILRTAQFTDVFTIAKAKVPICKFFDPATALAGDININNLMALQNTRLIRRYADLDPRVRPFLFLVKAWAKARGLADAAKSGTISSYGWCMIALNFLQTRRPHRIIPSLHAIYLERLARGEGVPVYIEGHDVAFADDERVIADWHALMRSLAESASLRGPTLAELVVEFFHWMAHELPYERQVLSVRAGELIPKADKGWGKHISSLSRWLCVEEPFNPVRNLTNAVTFLSLLGLLSEVQRS